MSETHATKEMAFLIAKISTMKLDELTHHNGKKYQVHPHRRHIRNRLFHLRKGENEPEYDSGLRKWMELQFRPGMTWENFTFEWDVSPTEPLKVISIHEWVAAGGLLEQYKERSEKGYDVMQTRCTPTAFTKQG